RRSERLGVGGSEAGIGPNCVRPEARGMRSILSCGRVANRPHSTIIDPALCLFAPPVPHLTRRGFGECGNSAPGFPTGRKWGGNFDAISPAGRKSINITLGVDCSLLGDEAENCG